MHEGIQLFKQSIWTKYTEHKGGPKIFLLTGLRDKEILSAVQTTLTTVERDIETFNTHLGIPINTKLVGVYI